MEQIKFALQTLLTTLHDNLNLLLVIALSLWVLHIVNKILGFRLNYLGIIPRTPRGLIGIIVSPLLHGDANHLFFNTIPLLVLACFILTGGRVLFCQVTISIILISGILIWLFGRRAIHIGASALVTGYWGYLLINAYHQPSLLAIGVAFVCVYYFGGLFFGLFPSAEKVSWEGHLCGCVAGVATNYLFPMPVN
jgi:membrane associated rhomboid family serine protease